ncbi:MAG: helix-turn-helix transcriptional regulator, partial [Firmicutes bacterium]|nr:helix-turn-helix transcriptional regulator [Bacillota bacterium]
MTFGEKLKLVRTGAEERQEDLGESIGITKRTIILYEQGERTPRDDKVYEALSKHYNTPVEFWKEDKEDDPDKIEEYSRYRKTRNAARKLIDDAQGLFAGG